jgi:hypothetical protein
MIIHTDYRYKHRSVSRALAKACSELTLGVDGDTHLDRTR